MKTKFPRILKNNANALLVTIILMACLTVSIGGYLKYVQQQTQLGARSQQWNAAMALAEAGIEEGLEALNNGSSPALTVANGWNPVGNNIYVLGPRTLLNGQYYVTNDYSDPSQPTLTARAFVNMTTYSKAVNQFPGFFATAGVTTTPPTRAVKVTTSKGSMIIAAMVAKHSINMNGNKGMTDSFDSGFPLSKSTASGLYASQYSSTNGDVASIDGFVDAGNFTIRGDVSTGPNGTVTVGSQGNITGTITHDANYTFPQNSYPYNSGICPPGGIISFPSGTNQNIVTNVVGSTTPPPAPTGDQVIIASTNTISSSSTVWPGNQTDLKTNSDVKIVATNKVVTVASTNFVCGSTEYSTNKVPTGSKICSYWLNSQSTNSASYRFTLIASTNYTYNTNLVYSYSTNYTYYYTTYTYNYTIYASQITYTNQTYDHVLCGDYYCPNGLSGSTYVSCPSRLVMTNGWQMSGGDTLTIGSGASLTNYVGGDKLSISGDGIVNASGKAQNLVIIAADSVNELDFSLNGNASFTGVLVAPNATAKMNGGGNSSTNDFVGAILADTITMNGHFQFHYDEALSRIGGGGRYLITSWREIP